MSDLCDEVWRRIREAAETDHYSVWLTNADCKAMAIAADGPTGTEAQVCADIAARQQLGIAKYGTTVADNPLACRDWMRHAYEEMLDGAIYLKRAIDPPRSRDRGGRRDRRREIMEMTSTDPAGLADLMLAWEDELSQVMPRDSKDWWQGDRSEWPKIARESYQDLQRREEMACDRCDWCGEPGEMSDMEQLDQDAGRWLPLCETCAAPRRLPTWPALLPVRRAEVEDDSAAPACAACRPAFVPESQRVQWWLGKLDRDDNVEALIDGAHSEAGAHEAMYLTNRLGLAEKGAKYAVVRCEVYEPIPDGSRANQPEKL